MTERLWPEWILAPPAYGGPAGWKVLKVCIRGHCRYTRLDVFAECPIAVCAKPTRRLDPHEMALYLLGGEPAVMGTMVRSDQT